MDTPPTTPQKTTLPTTPEITEDHPESQKLPTGVFDADLQGLLKEFNDALSSGTLSTTSSIALITKGIELVDRFSHLSGPDKLALLKTLLVLLVKTSQLLSPTSQDAVIKLLDSDLFVDLVGAIVSASKGKLDINRFEDIVEDVQAFDWRSILVPITLGAVSAVTYVYTRVYSRWSDAHDPIVPT